MHGEVGVTDVRIVVHLHQGEVTVMGTNLDIRSSEIVVEELEQSEASDRLTLRNDDAVSRTVLTGRVSRPNRPGHQPAKGSDQRQGNDGPAPRTPQHGLRSGRVGHR